MCIHHWIIDPPSGPTSKGRCKRCGEKRTFANTIIDNHMGDWSRIAQARDNRTDERR
jgi:hypothetical protein